MRSWWWLRFRLVLYVQNTPSTMYNYSLWTALDPCTDYYYPNASDSRGVSGLHDYGTGANTIGGKVPGNDAEFIVDRFITFMDTTLSENKNFYAHLSFHSIHEPHPAMPEYYHMYAKDPDYLGALTQFDTQLGRLMATLKDRGEAPHLLTCFTVWCETKLIPAFFFQACTRILSSFTRLIMVHIKDRSGQRMDLTRFCGQPTFCGNAKRPTSKAVFGYQGLCMHQC